MPGTGAAAEREEDMEMIVDAHVHVWELPTEQRPWQPLADLRPDYGWPVESQIKVMDECGIDKAVLVQTSYWGFDNHYLIDCGSRYPDRFWLVGLVDPREDSVESSIDSLYAHGVRGLRLPILPRPDIPWINDERAHLVWDKAGNLEMIVTLFIDLTQVKSAAETIRRFPNVRVAIDHLARPDTVDDPDGRLFEGLLALAQHDKVYIKVSALGFMSKEPYPHEDMLRLVRRIFDAFGPDRIMWGSDTPGTQKPETLPQAMRLIDLAFPDASSEVRAKLMGGTAAQLFG